MRFSLPVAICAFVCVATFGQSLRPNGTLGGGLASPAPNIPARYFSMAFKEPYYGSVTPYAYISYDGNNWATQSTTFPGSSVGFGNTSVLQHDATHCVMAFEEAIAHMGDPGLPMGIATSDCSLKWQWTAISTNLAAGKCSGMGGFFTDPADGSEHLIAFGLNGNDNIPVECHPVTPGDYSVWSAPVSIGCTGGNFTVATNPIATFYNTLYYQIYRNGGSGNPDVCTSSTLTGTYTFDKTISPWGSVESYSVLSLGGAAFQGWFYDPSGQHMYTSTSTNGPDGTWSTKQLLNGLGDGTANPVGAISVIKLPALP